MADYKRICEDCANQTDETICPICGRKTVPLKAGHRESIFLKDNNSKKANWDLEMAGDEGDKESRRYHKEPKNSTLHMAEDGHPYYRERSGSKKGNLPSFQKTIVVIVGILGLIIFLGVLYRVLIDKDLGNEPGSGETVLTNYAHVLDPVDEEADVSCEVEKHNGQSYLHVKNPSEYFVGAKFQDENDADIKVEVPVLEPYSDQQIEISGEPKSCTYHTKDSKVQKLDYYNPSFSYKYIKDPQVPSNATILVSEGLEGEEIRDFAKYLYAGKKVSRQEDIQQFQLNIENKKAYTIIIDEPNSTIEFLSYNSFEELEPLAIWKDE